MEKLSEDQLLDLIEQKGGPRGLDLRGRDLSRLKLGRADVVEKLRQRGHTPLGGEELLARWQGAGSWQSLPLGLFKADVWERLRVQGYVQGDPPPWFSPDGPGLNLSGAGLQKADLSWANLQHAILAGADLQNADLTRANLQNADLAEAKLQNANLAGADLQNANLGGADLQNAILLRANLQNAILWGANLQHAWLARVEGLEGARLENAVWGHYRLGEEAAEAYQAGEAVYRQLKQWYIRSGQYDRAGEFHYREMECQCKEAQKTLKAWQKTPEKVRKEWPEAGNLFWLWVFRFSCGYGERPLRTLACLGVAFLVPALFYWLLAPLSPGNAFYLSGAFLVPLINPMEVRELVPQSPGWLDALALVQAYAGYILLALFLVVLVIKMGHR